MKKRNLAKRFSREGRELGSKRYRKAPDNVQKRNLSLILLIRNPKNSMQKDDFYIF